MKVKALYISWWLLLVTAGFGLNEVAAQVVTTTWPTLIPSGEEVGRVVRVVDADTYDVLAGSVVYRVRLLGVDAPERDQPFGKQANDSVVRLLTTTRPVLLGRHSVDLYGRTLATIRLQVAGGKVLALDSLLVVRGWAWAWDPRHQIPGRAAQQAAALAARRGLWKCGSVGVLTPRQWRQFNYKNKRRYGVGCTW